MKTDELKARTDHVLGVVGLSDRADDLTKEFSGGMKRRLNIGIGLLHQPELLILDEPTVGVDPQSRNAILESVEALSKSGMAVLYTTHYMEEAERLCDRVGIIDSGKVIAEGTRRQLVDLVGEKDRVSIAGTGISSRLAGRTRPLEGVDRSRRGRQRGLAAGRGLRQSPGPDPRRGRQPRHERHRSRSGAARSGGRVPPSHRESPARRMRNLWTITMKDLRLRLRDRSFFIIGLIAPLALAFIFNTVFGSAFGDEGFSPALGIVATDSADTASVLHQISDAVGSELTEYSRSSGGRGGSRRGGGRSGLRRPRRLRSGARRRSSLLDRDLWAVSTPRPRPRLPRESPAPTCARSRRPNSRSRPRSPRAETRPRWSRQQSPLRAPRS